jgi:cytidine deaminase
MKKLEIISSLTQYDQINELPEEDQKLILAAREVTKNSYSPYSNFKVGAALLLDNGKIITGTNQENAAYPSGLCAERTAIFWANSQYPNSAIVKMAITAKKNGQLAQTPLAPCGACRQVMIESETRYNTKIKIFLDGQDSILSVENAASLLPLSFDSKSLK